MSKRIRPQFLYYDWLEERSLDLQPTEMRRNVQMELTASKSFVRDFANSDFPWWKTRILEDCAEADDSEGVWPTNFYRVERQQGDPGQKYTPRGTNPKNWPDSVESLARSMRLHHYFRVKSLNAAIAALQFPQVDLRFGLLVTADWYHPPDGHLPDPPNHELVLGSHSIPIAKWDAPSGAFVFPNSWGEEWGHNGWGTIPGSYFDRFVFEPWCRFGQGTQPPLKQDHGIRCLRWKHTAFQGQSLFGLEIVNAATRERIAWSFCVRNGAVLEIEEFYVWPTFRRQGFGRKLSQLVLELANRLNCTISLTVAFADATEKNEASLHAGLRLLGLHLHQSSKPWAPYFGLTAPPKFVVPRRALPSKPASIRDRLSPTITIRGACDDKDAYLYSVYFATNRRPYITADGTKSFSSERAAPGEECYGVCQISIPQSHQFGSIGSSWWKRWVKWNDDRLRLERVDLLRKDTWADRICSALEDVEQSDALIYIHGYNVTFEDAAIRAAQIGFDLKVPGFTAFFSWPSLGHSAGYVADGASIEASEHSIANFILFIANVIRPRKIHVVAHSMGNRGLLRSLHHVESIVKDRSPTLRLGQVFLAAPDVDSGLFRQLASIYPRMSERTTLYASPGDKALWLSNALHCKFERAGLTPPVVIVDGIDTVEVLNANIFDLGHGYYAEARGLLNDMFTLMRHNSHPDERQRLRSTSDATGTFWKMGME